jgi:hypothetical protein
MENGELLTEIRMLRSEITDLKKEFYIFKGKAFAFISILSVIGNFLVEYVKGHK